MKLGADSPHGAMKCYEHSMHRNESNRTQRNGARMIGGAELVTLKWWKNLNRYTCIPDLLKLFPLKRGWIPTFADGLSDMTVLCEFLHVGGSLGVRLFAGLLW